MTDIAQKTRVADSRKAFNNSLSDIADVAPQELAPQMQKSTLNIYMVTNKCDPWNKSEISNLFQAASMAEAANAFVKSIDEYRAKPGFHRGIKIVHHEELRFQVIEYKMPQGPGLMNLHAFKWYSIKDHPQWARQFPKQVEQTKQDKQIEQDKQTRQAGHIEQVEHAEQKHEELNPEP